MKRSVCAFGGPKPLMNGKCFCIPCQFLVASKVLGLGQIVFDASRETSSTTQGSPWHEAHERPRARISREGARVAIMYFHDFILASFIQLPYTITNGVAFVGIAEWLQLDEREGLTSFERSEQNTVPRYCGARCLLYSYAWPGYVCYTRFTPSHEGHRDLPATLTCGLEVRQSLRKSNLDTQSHV